MAVRRLRHLSFALGAMVLASPLAAQTLDKLVVAVGQRGGWPTSIPEIAQNNGVFARHGLNVEVIYTAGGGETIQPVISGQVDIGVAVSTSTAMAIFLKGAPIRVIGNQTTGAKDIVWYVQAKSPIQSVQDFAGRSLSYSTRGSSTHVLALGLMEHFKFKATLVQTGSMTSTLTQALTGQVDVGWLAPPVGLDAAEEGKTRIIANGDVVPKYKDQTVRVMVVNTQALTSKRSQIVRFLAGYRETVEWMYDGDKSIADFAKLTGFSERIIKRTRDEFYPKETIHPDTPLSGLDGVMADAIEYKILPEKLNADQLKQLIEMPLK